MLIKSVIVKGVNMERTLSPKRDIRMFIDEMNRSSQSAANLTDSYKRGLLTLEEYITELFRIEKDMIRKEAKYE